MAPAASSESGEDAPDEALWLSADEKEAWTGLVSLVLLLPGRLEAPLQHAAGVSLFEYLTLSHISEAPGRRLRMSELAHLANGSLSRLSNVVKRFEQRGWVERSPDPDDGRYTLAALTDAGYAVGDRVALLTPGPRLEAEVVGVFTFGDSGGLAGASLTAFDRETAQALLGAGDGLTGIDVLAADGRSDTQVRDAVAAVPLLHVADHLAAPRFAEVDIEVGHRHALGVEEALEDQPEPHRVEIGDRQRPRDDRPRA